MSEDCLSGSLHHTGAITSTPVSAASARITAPIRTGACIRTDRGARPHPAEADQFFFFSIVRPHPDAGKPCRRIQ